MVRACQRWDLQMPCSQNWPYSALRFAPPRDNSRIVGYTEVILQPRSRSNRSEPWRTWTIYAVTGKVKSWYGTFPVTRLGVDDEDATERSNGFPQRPHLSFFGEN
jgi:hypothetical protein